ncbi:MULTISPECIES: cytochrome c-type biogenesis protein [Kordiimonas]|jgi:cytochrome c-type biogenesis protein CcmH|uniref:cytochrome c-type biogenesis protein n=1 Tax=Kordiimonas TaxID=288021 RepID=UPI00257E16D1|nr:cytochrome c-type biogenesis protein [Kordiimonas sp. UBA4487]
MMRALTAILLTIALTVAALAVAVDEKPLEDPAKEAMARELMKELRCVVCQNQSIEDSNADIARDLRQIVRERIAMGDTPDNVKAYLVDRYGDYVLLEPPLKPTTYFLWGSPFIFLGFVVYMVLRSRKKPVAPVPLSAEEQAELDKILGKRKDDV